MAKLGKLIDEAIELDRKAGEARRETQAMIDALARGPEKAELQRQFNEGLAALGLLEEREPAKPARADWTRAQWIAEAEHQRATARVWRRAGREKEARACMTRARKAEQRAAEAL